MARRRTKKRTHVQPTADALKGIPKSMVIRVGQTSLANHALNQLVKDFRQIMQPHTAIRLKERKSNKLKDFVVMCGPLDVSHLFIFTQSEKTGNVSLKVARTPNGPTITFQVQDYSLSKDIKKYLKKPKSLNSEDVLSPPLLVMNGFNNKLTQNDDADEKDEKKKVEKIVVSMFQNIFPPLNPSQTHLNSIKRVFMINKDAKTGEISLRHYFIEIKDVEISKSLKSLFKAKSNPNKKLPVLTGKQDISSLILDHDIDPYTSESEVDEQDPDSIISVMEKNKGNLESKISIKQKIDREKQKEEQKRQKELDIATGLSTNNEGHAKVEDEGESTNGTDGNINLDENLGNPKKKAIRLTEVGPRLTLKLVKLEEGICSGKVLYHEYVHKTDAEIKKLEKRHLAKMRLKEERRKEQEANIARKKAVKDAKKERKMERRAARKALEKDAEGDEKMDGDKSAESDDDSDSNSDSEHNYSDVPEDIDSDLFSDLEEATQ
ncbi:similar to Saccharomyces cerevisiae YHR066W SSF1 Constituent of 66S pre-ribosomal particles, required for ribosomal large subunit maturation [Maudiozyma saulgeensis]|uniref:Similar to Saccharomyces cerevisiae YHR066W SSF1 Constituent of 66S pre-ribosomal particles, required for ribosomal large subunit maturation n=1 Tax=Maudiozyma saulgeensis TaxID=1789683 RepID=A0A1X7QXR3_9SACH|nr:similar to Saccharomyces cerevisiae YHR066W SSF1 Constituent of 66S pre-ribosomal particles, required for ribosomal large subunit maturation [Kazachstania saulgeensis]